VGHKAVIAEDEPVLRRELIGLLARLWPDLEISADVGDGIEALGALAQHAPDVLFLDIQMPGMTGLEVAQKANGRAHIVFVTAFDQHAVTAFEQGAVDYVLKPFSAARLATSIERLKAKLQTAPANLDGLLKSLSTQLAGARQHLRWITATQGTEVRLITIDEVCYFQADNKYTLVVTADQESLIRRPIRELLEELDPASFWQIHRSTVINVNAVAGVHRDMSGHLRVKLKQRKETLSVSESYMHLFRSM
jgi:DNA-binding LytR/AlgR family response regulator